MIWIVLAFLAGCLYTRTYYALINKQTDWMKSSTWSNNSTYQKLHLLNCKLCPKHWYCPRYKEKTYDNDRI